MDTERENFRADDIELGEMLVMPLLASGGQPKPPSPSRVPRPSPRPAPKKTKDQ